MGQLGRCGKRRGYDRHRRALRAAWRLVSTIIMLVSAPNLALSAALRAMRW
jgi:hypothetical protein